MPFWMLRTGGVLRGFIKHHAQAMYNAMLSAAKVLPSKAEKWLSRMDLGGVGGVGTLEFDNGDHMTTV